MHIGIRKIRSAGRASGSIEITLPPELAPLEGLDCRILLRDGARPEIVLQPDLTGATGVLKYLWGRLRALLSLVGNIGELSLQEFNLTLLPAANFYGKPGLAFADALRAGVRPGRADLAPVNVEAPEDAGEDGGPLGRLTAALATLAGRRLGLDGNLAPRFGALLAGLIVSEEAFPGGGPEQELIRRLRDDTFGPTVASGRILLAPDEGGQVRQTLRRVVGQYRYWQEHPDRHEGTCMDAGSNLSLILTVGQQAGEHHE